jgi:hypothetical protein
LRREAEGSKSGGRPMRAARRSRHATSSEEGLPPWKPQASAD